MPPIRSARMLPKRRSVPARTMRRRAIRSSVHGGWRVRLRRSFSRLRSGGRGNGGSRCNRMLNWTAPAALWLLAFVPLVWLAPLVARTTFNPRQRVLQAAARSLLLAALALAIARTVLSTTSPRQSIVYVVDVSHSIASRAIEEAARTIDQMNGTLHPAWSRILVFGSTTATMTDTAALRRIAPIDAA